MKAYISPIVMGILVSLLLLYLVLIPLLIYQYRTHGSLKMRRNTVIASFIIYIITAWFMTVLPLPPLEEVRSMKPIEPNLQPFLFVKTFLGSSGFILTRPATWLSAIRSSSFYTVAFNVVLTIPFGIYLRKYFKLRLLWVIVLGFGLSLFYELTQYSGLYGLYPQAYRFADVDDLIVNTSGAVIGYFLAGVLDHLLPNPENDRDSLTKEVGIARRLLALLVDSIAINVLFEISRLAFYLGSTNRPWDLALFIASEAIVFLLLPLLTTKKQTVGMLALNLYLIGKDGGIATTSKALLHNLLAGILLHCVFEIQGRIPGESFVTIGFQLLLLLGSILLIIKSLPKRKICYYWETWLGTYLVASLPKRIRE